MKINTRGLCVEIEAVAWERVRQWTQLASGEFSCLGLVDDALLLSEVHLLEQECTDSTTELDPAAVAKLLVAVERPEQARAWIHSHADMKAFWSNTDEACIEGLANESFLVSLVTNRAGDYRCRVDLFRPVRLTIDNVPVVVRVTDPTLAAECKQEFEQKVREVPITFKLTALGEQALRGFDADDFGSLGDWPQFRGGRP